jgi:hypothetical protein
MNEHTLGAPERLTKVLEECEAKWDRLFRDAPLGTGEAPPGLTKAQAVIRAAQEKLEVMMPDAECAEFLTTFFTESELKLYRLALEHDLKVDAVKDVVKLLRNPAFDPDDIRDGLHSKFQALIQVSSLQVGCPVCLQNMYVWYIANIYKIYSRHETAMHYLNSSRT